MERKKQQLMEKRKSQFLSFTDIANTHLEHFDNDSAHDIGIDIKS